MRIGDRVVLQRTFNNGLSKNVAIGELVRLTGNPVGGFAATIRDESGDRTHLLNDGPGYTNRLTTLP